MEQNAFINRVLGKLRAHAGSVVFIAGSDWGAPYAFEAFRAKEELCIWLKLEPDDEGDLVAQGNKLSDAVTRALGSPLFGQAMPYSYGLAVLREHLSLFEPLTVVLSGADYGQDLANDLVKLQRPGCKVVLEFADLPSIFLIPDTALILTPSDLKLLPEEALELSLERLNQVETLNLLKLSGGAYEGFLLGLHKRLSLPAKLRPGPDKAELPPGAEVAIAPATMLAVFIRRGQFLEALEVAVEHVPERVPELIDRAGLVYLNKGLYQRLWNLLSQLPAELKGQERLLFWRFRSARRIGQAELLRSEVEHYLANHEAPELRALYATFMLAYPASLAQAERAYQQAKTPITLQHYSTHLLKASPEKSLEVAHEFVNLCAPDDHYWRSQAFSAVASALTHMGHYKEGLHWLEETISSFDEHGGGDWQFRMNTVNNWACTRIAMGETVGLAEILKSEERALRDAFPALAFSFRSTLGDYFRSQNRPHEALYYYEKNLQILSEAKLKQGTDIPTFVVKDVVHCLLHLGDVEKAASLARKHYHLSRAASPDVRAYASLAQAMVLSFLEPVEALGLLEEAVQDFSSPLQAPALATAVFFLARTLLNLGKRKQAQDVLQANKTILKELGDTGFRLLAGPEEQFRDLWSLWRSNQAKLHLHFLGGSDVIMNNKLVNIYPLWCEILALLVIHRKGLRLEALLAELYGDEGKLTTLKSTLSRIRELIPLSRPPYHIEVSFEADFLQVERYLKEGRIRAALELYKGPLLPKSDISTIIEARETLEESLRQAVLESDDAEALLSLAERLKEDPDVWEAAIAALPQNDPRHSLASAKHKKLLEAWGFA